MSESRSRAGSTDDARDLDEIGGELYALRPDAFASARDERVRAARAEGRAALARELGRLRRPTQSAWLVNLLWRAQRELMEQLLQLGADLREAQAHASGPELHRLTGRRRELEAALLRAARALAEQAGVALSPTLERETQETLGAALARPDVADEVRSGRLLKPAAYAGFGPLVAGEPLPGPAQPATVERARREADEQREAAARREAERREEDARREAARREAERGRAAAEHRVQEARAALEAATAALAERGRAAEVARLKQVALRKQVDEARARLRDLEQEAAVAEHTARAAAERRDQAEKAHAAAFRALQAAQQSLQE